MFLSKTFSTNTYTTIKDGNYQDPSTWKNGNVPDTNIPNNSIIQVDHNLKIQKNIRNEGTIIVNKCGKIISNKNVTNEHFGLIHIDGIMIVTGIFSNYGNLNNFKDFTIGNIENYENGFILNSKNIYVLQDYFLNKGGITSGGGTIFTKNYFQKKSFSKTNNMYFNCLDGKTTQFKIEAGVFENIKICSKQIESVHSK